MNIPLWDKWDVTRGVSGIVVHMCGQSVITNGAHLHQQILIEIIALSERRIHG